MLIASRCKNYPENEYPGHGNCFSPEVLSELKRKMGGDESFEPTIYKEELNAFCRECNEWNPIHDKPREFVAYSCFLCWKIPPDCPNRDVWGPIHQKLAADPARLDEICRECKFFEPFSPALSF